MCKCLNARDEYNVAQLLYLQCIGSEGLEWSCVGDYSFVEHHLRRWLSSEALYVSKTQALGDSSGVFTPQKGQMWFKSWSKPARRSSQGYVGSCLREGTIWYPR